MFIPGRIEVLGKHTDYCGGRSVVCAIDRGFHAEVEPRADWNVVLTSRDSGDIASIDIYSAMARPGHWSNYAVEVARSVGANFGISKKKGATISYHSDLPQAAGLSSSSAMIIMIFAALDRVNDLQAATEFRENISSEVDLAEYLGCVENGRSFRRLEGSRGVGTFGGSQDHAAILLGKTARLSEFSFSPLAHVRDFEFPAGYAFVVASSGVTAEKTGSALEKYNRVSRMISEIKAAFGGGKSLTQIIDEIGLNELKREIVQRPFSFSHKELIHRVEQFYVESYEIIPHVSGLLAAGQIDKIGDFVDLSQRNVERFLDNQIDETIFLQRSARNIGATAASAFGAGFGGSVYSIVKMSEAEKFSAEWRRIYLNKFPQHVETCKFFMTRPAECSRT